MICELINPSDPYTIETSDFIVAAVAVAILRNGKIGLKNNNGDKSPIIFGWSDWFEKQGITDIDKYINEHKTQIADVLDSVLIGNEKDRKFVERTLSFLEEDKRQAWLDTYIDTNRSSLNDIGGYAKELANNFRNKES